MEDYWCVHSCNCLYPLLLWVLGCNIFFIFIIQWFLLFVCLFFLCLLNRVSLCSIDSFRTYSVNQIGLKNQRSPAFACQVLGCKVCTITAQSKQCLTIVILLLVLCPLDFSYPLFSVSWLFKMVTKMSWLCICTKQSLIFSVPDRYLPWH